MAARPMRASLLGAKNTALGIVTVVSFVFCVAFTITNPAPAYFVTFGRMWQFGVGAMIALVPLLRVRNAIGSFVLGWGGILVLLYATFRFDGQTPFPGYMAAIPTLGVDAAGTPPVAAPGPFGSDVRRAAVRAVLGVHADGTRLAAVVSFAAFFTCFYTFLF